MLLMSLCKQAYQIVAALQLTAVAARARTSSGLQITRLQTRQSDTAFRGKHCLLYDSAIVLACQVWLVASTDLSLTTGLTIQPNACSRMPMSQPECPALYNSTCHKGTVDRTRAVHFGIPVQGITMNDMMLSLTKIAQLQECRLRSSMRKANRPRHSQLTHCYLSCMPKYIVFCQAAHVQETSKLALGMLLHVDTLDFVGFFRQPSHKTFREALGMQQPPVMPLELFSTSNELLNELV